MYKEYIDVLISMIEKFTEGKTDLTNLGLFLAQQNNASALKILKLIIQASQYNKIEKKIDVNKKVKVSETTFFGEIHEHNENIVSRLVDNHLYISREVLEYIAKTNKVNFNFKPYDSLPLDYNLAEIVLYTKWQNNNFYKRSDLAIKNLEILDYFSKKGIIKLTKRGIQHTHDILSEYRENNPADNEINKIIKRHIFCTYNV